jgi:hypothetical protein
MAKAAKHIPGAVERSDRPVTGDGRTGPLRRLADNGLPEWQSYCGQCGQNAESDFPHGMAPPCSRAVITTMTAQSPDQQAQSYLSILVISPYRKMQKMHLPLISFQLPFA